MSVIASGVNVALRLVLIGAIGGLSGCGFRLEGAGELPAAMERTFVDAKTPNSEFTNSIRDALRLRGKDLVSSREDADAVLVVSQDDAGQRVLSVSARNTPREYEIYYIVTISLRAGGAQLMEPESLVATRTYTYDETEVLGKSAEERILRRALADDLARQVLRRLETVAAVPSPLSARQ